MDGIESTSRFFICCTTTLVISVGLFYAYARYKLSYWSRRGVKTPPTHWIFGNFKDVYLLRKSPGELMRDIYDSADQNDPYIGFYIFYKPILLLRDSDLIKQVMVKHYNVFPNRRFGSFDGRDILDLQSLLSITSQPLWKYLRTKFTPAFSGQKLKGMMPLITRCNELMLKYIDELSTNKNGDKSQDMLEIASSNVSNVLSSIMYGVDTNAFDPKDNGFLKATQDIFRGIRRAFVLITYFFTPHLIPFIRPFSKWPVKYFRKRFEEVIKNREKTGNTRGDLMDFLIMFKNGEQNPIYKFEGDNLLAHAAAFHVAGFEASATASAWALYELARNPEHQDTLYKEIKEYLSGKEISMELISEMSFLDCIVNETLRLYPPIPVIDRITEMNFEVQETGLIIEKDVPIYMSVRGMSYDSRYFTDACKFLPLREKTETKLYESLAFGIGPRYCLGQKLGLLIVKTTIINIISNYEISTSKKEGEDDFAMHFFTYAAGGFNIKFKKRE